MIKVEYTDEIPMNENEMLEALDTKLAKQNSRYHWKLSYPREKYARKRKVTTGRHRTREQLIKDFPFVAPLLEGTWFGFLLQMNRDGEWLRITQAHSAISDMGDDGFIPIKDIGGSDE